MTIRQFVAYGLALFAVAYIVGLVTGCGPGKESRVGAWAERAKTYASGGVPDDLQSVAAAPKAEPREVFLYVISGHKAHNPAAAMALIERLG